MNSNKIAGSLLIAIFASAFVFGAEKSSAKEKDKTPPEHHRGWIGGDYKLVRRHWNWFMSEEAVVAFPKSIPGTEKKGLLVTALSTNTPAYIAGLREGDLILELDHAKITSVRDFRRKIDQMKPGSPLSVRAFRAEDTSDYDVTVGRETYRHQGACGVALLPILAEPNLKFNPGFSLIALGLTWDKGKRAELGSPEQVYRQECSKEHYPSDGHWRAWVGVIFAEHNHEIRAQEIVAR